MPILTSEFLTLVSLFYKDNDALIDWSDSCY